MNEAKPASGCTGPSDCSASVIYEIMASKMKSIKGQWRDFNLYVATHDDLWHIANLIAKQNADLERTARSDGTLQDFVGDSKS
jgi:stalled ribosome rescue protein Dom34